MKQWLWLWRGMRWLWRCAIPLGSGSLDVWSRWRRLGVDGEYEQADETDVGNGSARFSFGAAVWVLRARRIRVRGRASRVRARFL